MCSSAIRLTLVVFVSFKDRVLINQWKDEIISGFRLSSQIMANMNKKVRSKYGADMLTANNGINGNAPQPHPHPPQRSLEKCSSEES